MLGEHSALDESVEEILINLMAEKVMYVSIQASSMGRLQASPSTTHWSSRTAIEKRSKHRNDIVSIKQILSVFLDYILPLDGVVSHDSIPCDFEYMLIIVYLLKGIRVVKPQLGLIPALKINDFNIGY
jgi:hypothetical protein